jgi:F-type H+-transporting ATPase subunit epsilon
MNSLKLKIVTPDGVVYEDEVEEVVLPTVSGQIGVLPNHIPLISRLKSGEIEIRKNGTAIGIAVSTGFLEIRPNNEVYIVADTAERSEHIDLARAEAAHKRAQELLTQQQNMEDVQFVALQIKIEKELARLGVARKYRHRG